MPSARKQKPRLTERDLSRWKLIEEFRARIEADGGAAHRTFANPRRHLGQGDYLSLMLFGLFNPVVDAMRGLCEASKLRRVQRDICTHPVSLGSFSEAQSVVDPGLLRRVFEGLAAEAGAFRGDPRLEPYRKDLLAVDGTIWAALPRMAWAMWRHQQTTQNALKLHVKFNVLEEKPVGAVLRVAKRCERAVLREQMRAGEFCVGDRYYGEDYALFEEMRGAGVSFVMRLRAEARWEVVEEFALGAEDRAAGVVFDGLVRLGARKKSAPVRLVRVQSEGHDLLLVTDKPRGELCAELIALIYRYRWRIELFFKWIKCILGCRHWLAESENGVALQVYCALIAALLLLRATGRRPGKRAMEMIRFYLMGVATLDELCAALDCEKNPA